MKSEGDDGGPTEDDMRNAYEKDALAKYTLPVLKGFLAEKGLKTTGKKADLVDAVTRYFETRMQE